MFLSLPRAPFQVNGVTIVGGKGLSSMAKQQLEKGPVSWGSQSILSLG